MFLQEDLELLQDLFGIKVGDTITIYKDPIERTRVEGEAKVIELLHGVPGDSVGVFVEFPDDPGVKCYRQVYWLS